MFVFMAFEMGIGYGNDVISCIHLIHLMNLNLLLFVSLFCITIVYNFFHYVQRTARLQVNKATASA